MNFEKLVARVRNILLTPRSEWPAIAAEPASVAGLYKGYILVLAALPALAWFIRFTLFGPFGFGRGLLALILHYVLALALVYVVALIVNALATGFDGQKDTVQALKVTAYAWTASWIAGIAVLLPWLGTLIALAGAVYAIYLLYLGLPATMKCPPERAAAYTAVSTVIAIVLGALLSILLGVMTGAGALMGGFYGMHRHHGLADFGHHAASDGADDWSRRMRDATGKIDRKVESLPAERVRAFLPDDLDDFDRADISAERQNALGMQVSRAEARYRDDDGHDIRLEIVDTGGARGLLAMAGAMAPEMERKDDHGFEKSYRDDGRMIHERWDDSADRGEYSVVVGERFVVKASGHVDDLDDLKDAVDEVDLDALEDLKDAGAQH